MPGEVIPLQGITRCHKKAKNGPLFRSVFRYLNDTCGLSRVLRRSMRCDTRPSFRRFLRRELFGMEVGHVLLEL